MVLLYICMLLIVAYVTHTWWKRKNLPPGPFGWPIIGSLTLLDPKVPYKTLTDLAKKYGPVYGINLGNIYTVVLTDPKTIRKTLAKDAASGRAPLFLTHGVMKGYGIICSEGELWKDQRRFTANCLRQMGGTKIGHQREKMESMILSHVSDLITHLDSLGESPTLDPLEPLRHSVGSAVNMIVFGECFEESNPTWKHIQYLQEEGTKCMGVAGPMNFLPFLRFIPYYKKNMTFLLEGIIATHKFYDEIIGRQSIILQEKLKENPKHEATTILHAFLMEKEKRRNTNDNLNFYCDQQFHYLMADLFGAGLDTTLSTLTWYLLYISIHKDVQTKVREELTQVVNNKSPTLNDLEFLPLTEASIAETLRIRSVIPTGIPHGSLSELDIDGYTIPAHTMIIPLQWAVHMNEKCWSDPERFDPQRFIDEEGKFYKPESFIPFQNGKRMCVGDELARMFLYLYISKILLNYEMDAIEPEKIDLTGICGLTMTPHHYEVKFKRISN